MFFHRKQKSTLPFILRILFSLERSVTLRTTLLNIGHVQLLLNIHKAGGGVMAKIGMNFVLKLSQRKISVVEIEKKITAVLLFILFYWFFEIEVLSKLQRSSFLHLPSPEIKGVCHHFLALYLYQSSYNQNINLYYFEAQK